MQDTSLFFNVYFNAAPRKVDAAVTARNETFQEMSNPSGLLNKHMLFHQGHKSIFHKYIMLYLHV